jgi:hypothetical protein
LAAPEANLRNPASKIRSIVPQIANWPAKAIDIFKDPQNAEVIRFVKSNGID